MTAWTYMLRCADGSFYVGCTTDFEMRMAQHHAGHFSGYTSERRPVELVWSDVCEDVEDAIAMERRIKGWGRAKKMALIDGDWAVIRALGLRPSRRAPPSSG
jgi:predicted GIY-YIG superfamily endonuclease